MPLEWDGNRTEAPTPRRREGARRQGQVVLSPDLSTAVQLLTASLVLLLLGSRLGSVLSEGLTRWLRLPVAREWSVAETIAASHWLGEGLAAACGPLIVVLTAVGLLVVLLQTGWSWSLEPLGPNWGRLSPVRGWERLRSGESLQRALWAVLRFGGFLAIAATFLAVFGDRIVSSGMGTPGRLMRTSWRFSLSMVALLGGMSLVLGLADYVTRWLRHEAQLRMTRAELKQELKEDQGDPQIRATIRRLQRERLKRRSLREVPQATLVLTNPTHVAVALRYDPGSVRAPRVLAKGTGELAQRIKQIARLHDVPVVENPPLARALYKSVEIQQEIPVEYYRAVAEILARLFRERSAA